ncbi:hypothetical protein PAPYR_12163 [Paratrimastix pyriformis]|uniref:Uncharacterized protein n=1 Tax=Paratrimastix pyriformis TaxID=342808 RepID=A0ABQ8U2B3_9EUKA|nr:hypothetical protein PAPYR_12163 [Paratrimastix pyriformis]
MTGPYLHRTSGSVLNSFFVRSPAPAATHTAPGAPPAPTPTAPKAPTALTARPTTPASGAVEHKDKGTGAARPILDDDDVPSPPKPKKAAPAAAKPKKDREAPEEGKKAAPVAAKSKKEAAKEAKAAAPAPPPARRKPGPPHEAKEAAEAKGSDDAPRRTPGRGTGTSTRPQWRSPPRRRTRAAVPRTQGEGRAQAGPTDRPGRLLPGGRSPSTACHGKRAHVLLSSIDPCPSLARPLAYERLGAIVEWFEKLGAAVLFSIIVQTSALDEARYQVVDGSHRFQVARIIVDPRRVSELPPEITAEQRTELRQRVEKLNKLHPRSGRRTTSTWPFTTLDPEAMLELQHRVNLLTHDARFGSSTFDVLLNLKRASSKSVVSRLLIIITPPPRPYQAPKRYIREDPDFATHLEPALKELHFPKGEDAPAKLVKILECFSLEMLCALSQLPVERQPSATNLWRIFEARDAEMNRWLARAMLEGSFSGSEATSTAAADLKKPIRQAEQTFMLLEAHDAAAEVAAGDHPPVLYLPPDEAAREILRCHLVRTETFAFMNCLNVRPFPFRKGKVRLPAFSEELGELGCPFERLNETDVGNMPQEITFMDGRRLSEFELVLGYWLGWCAAQLPPAMQDYLMPEHCPYARLWEEMGHHDIPRASKRMLKTVDRELREERRALREEAASEHPEPPKSEPAKRATLKALLSQAEPTSEAEAKAAEADDEYEVKACALPPESATEEAQPSQEVCALGSEQAVRRPAPQTIEQIVRNALRTNLGNNELEMLIYCFIIGAMSTSVLDSPAPGQALAPAPGSADPVAAVAPAPLVPSPVVGGAAEEAVAGQNPPP